MNLKERYQYNPKTDLVGRGGFSKVFKAYDTVLHRQVALKVFTAEISEKYDLVNEIRRVISLDHPNLCRYYDVAFIESTTAMGEDEKLQVGIMEYLEGSDLETYCLAHPELCIQLLTDVLKGLSYLHKRGIIHRDLKPQNILIKITDDGPIAKITDFGISKDVRSSNTGFSLLMGTIEYMAPEQFSPEKFGINGKIATNLDLWSFGLIVYSLVSGNSLFGNRNNSSAEQVMGNIINEELTKEKISQLPEPYLSIASCCLVKDAKLRVQTAAELIPLLQGKPAITPVVNNDTIVLPKPQPPQKPAIETTVIAQSIETEVLHKNGKYSTTINSTGPKVEQHSTTGINLQKRKRNILFMAVGIAVLLVAGLFYVVYKASNNPSAVSTKDNNKQDSTASNVLDNKKEDSALNYIIYSKVADPEDTTINRQENTENASDKEKVLPKGVSKDSICDVVFTSNISCKLFINNNLKGVVYKDYKLKLTLLPGQYLLKAISVEDEFLVSTTNYIISHSNKGTQQKCDIFFNTKSFVTQKLIRELMKSPDEVNKDIVKNLILQGADVNARDGTDWTPLMWAARNNAVNIALLLLSKGANTNAKTNNHSGETALHLCATYNCVDIANELLKNGADINLKENYSGETPLIASVRHGYIELSRLFLGNGADVNATSNDGFTALILAANYNSTEIPRLLLNKGANVNAMSKDGFTALMRASTSFENTTDVARLLLDRGIDVNAKDENGFTALSYAKSDKMKNLLRQYGAQ